MPAPFQTPPRPIVEALQRGFLAFQAGDLGKAEAAFRKALSKDGRQFDALHMLAVISAQRGNYVEGIRLITQALAINPAFAEAHVNLGRMQAETGDYESAAGSYRRALNLNPRHPMAHANFSVVLRNLGFLEEALSHSQAAVTLAPNYADAWYNRGKIWMQLERFADARGCYERALAIDPAHVDAATGQALVFSRLGSYPEAISWFDRVLKHRPDHPHAMARRLFLKSTLCDWSDYEKDRDCIIERVRKAPSVSEPLILAALSFSAADQRKCAEDFVRESVMVTASPAVAVRPRTRDKIRVAYLSGVPATHPVISQMAGVFASHDRSRFELTAVSTKPDSTGEIHEVLAGAFDRVVDGGRQSDEAVAATIRELEIDIAVDLHVLSDYSRLGILARRPAPIQVNYLGYPGTAGAPHIDYLIADRTIVPEADQRCYTEKVVYLPDTYFPNDCRRPCPPAATTRQDEGLPERGFVFCGFNAPHKLTPAIFDVWMRLLLQIEGSVLWLRSARSSADENLCREAEKRGVLASRLVFAKYAPSPEDHLARHRHADLFLDTLPYNAHTTASDALWMGLPVLTCEGATFAGRVAASLLRAAGVDELIASSLDDYEKVAIKLALDPALLASFRNRLEAGRKASPLFDTARFTRHLEAAYTQMWERYQRGEQPASFAVGPLPAHGLD